MSWNIFMKTITGVVIAAGSSLLAPSFFRWRDLIKPLVRPITSIYLDVADEIAATIVERENAKAILPAGKYKSPEKIAKAEDAMEKKAGAEMLGK